MCCDFVSYCCLCSIAKEVGIKYWTHGLGHRKKDGRMERGRGRGKKEKESGRGKGKKRGRRKEMQGKEKGRFASIIILKWPAPSSDFMTSPSALGQVT